MNLLYFGRVLRLDFFVGFCFVFFFPDLSNFFLLTY